MGNKITWSLLSMGDPIQVIMTSPKRTQQVSSIGHRRCAERRSEINTQGLFKRGFQLCKKN